MKLIKSLALASLIVAGVPATAQDPYNFSDFTHQHSDMQAGLYFTLPFGRDARKNSYEYGFRLQMKRNFQHADFGQARVTSFSAEPFKVAFNKQGFDRLDLAGRSLLIRQDGKLMLADGDSEKGSGSTVLYVLGGVALLVGVGVLAVNDTVDDIADSIGNN